MVPTVAKLHGFAPAEAQPLGSSAPHALAAMEFALNWQSPQAAHTDCLVIDDLQLSRDVLPQALESDLTDRPPGHTVRHEFAPGDLLPAADPNARLTLPATAFGRRRVGSSPIQPRAGRFYPRGLLTGLQDIDPDDRTPFRVGRVEPELIVDLNHPLAERHLTLTARVLDRWRAGDGHAGHGRDIARLITANGPGMQARWRDCPTEFFADRPFARSQDEPDTAFYAKPRLVDHLDRTATTQVEALYGHLIPAGARILDLMSSWKSHLPARLDTAEVVGLGMNAEELAANPRLSERRVHDLNREPRLPFAAARFDAVVCTVSVEYLTQPFAVFAEVHRVLRPGGRFVLTFSNRWFPPKVIRAWQTCHEFERPGLVLEYFLRHGGFRDLETFSLRGLPRPADDKYADRLTQSDPVYAVWGNRT